MMSGCAGLWMRTVAPETKCDPVIIRTTPLVPFVAPTGLTELTVGSVSWIVKHPVHVATSVPGTGPLSTVTSRAPNVAELEIVTFTVMLVPPFTVCEFCVIPVPEKLTEAVGKKPLPFTVRLIAVAPLPSSFGTTPETE
jgi:hypothetical protein